MLHTAMTAAQFTPPVSPCRTRQPHRAHQSCRSPTAQLREHRHACHNMVVGVVLVTCPPTRHWAYSGKVAQTLHLGNLLLVVLWQPCRPSGVALLFASLLLTGVACVLLLQMPVRLSSAQKECCTCHPHSVLEAFSGSSRSAPGASTPPALAPTQRMYTASSALPTGHNLQGKVHE
jgi:hypothetical protein